MSYHGSVNIRERVEAFWLGQTPDLIPYTIYDWEFGSVKDDPAWLPMFENGLGVTYHLWTIKSRFREVESRFEEDGAMRREVWKIGQRELYQTWKNGWHDEYFLKDREDYRVMTEIVKQTVLEPSYHAYTKSENELDAWGIPLVMLGRSPLQTMMVDYAGLENFAFHMMDFEEEVQALYLALLDVYRQKVELIADGPGRYVAALENFTSESLGPVKYAKYLMPVYEECFPLLRSRGKIVGCHYDGRTASCSELIGRAPFDLIESLTEPPEGDLTLDACRAVWPEKLFWCNIQVSDYQMAPAQFKTRVQQLARRGAARGSRLAFEVSEHLPANWKESMPVVLEALRDLA